jgi:hypothetical protein
VRTRGQSGLGHGWHGRLRTGTGVLVLREDLGRSVPRRAAGSVEERTALKLAREAKVAELGAALLVEQHVLQLEVTVHDAAGMAVCDGEAQLAEHGARLLLAQAALLEEVVEELAAGAELGDEPDVRLRRDDLEQLDDVRVVQPAVVVDLARQRGRHGLWDLLHRDPRGREPVRAHPDLPERACAGVSIHGAYTRANHYTPSPMTLPSV